MFTVYHSNQLDLLKTLTSALIARSVGRSFSTGWCWCRAPAWRNGCRCSWRNIGIAANVAFRCRRPLFGTCSPGVAGYSERERLQQGRHDLEADVVVAGDAYPAGVSPLQHYRPMTATSARSTSWPAGSPTCSTSIWFIARSGWKAGSAVSVSTVWRRLSRQRALGATWSTRKSWGSRNGTAPICTAALSTRWSRQNVPARFAAAGVRASRRCRRSGGAAGAGAAYRYPPDVYQPLSLLLGRHSGLRFPARLQSRKRRHTYQAREQGLFREPDDAARLFDAEGQQQLSNPLLASWGKLGRDLSAVADGRGARGRRLCRHPGRYHAARRSARYAGAGRPCGNRYYRGNAGKQLQQTSA